MFICIYSSYACAQSISVRSFRLAENDLTANNAETEWLDQNGDKCALIRIQTTQKGFTFDVGSLGVQKTDENHASEIWVYVPRGIRHISIRHPQLGSLPNYDFPISIQSARTYILEITSDKVFINTYDDTKKQTLNVTVTPANSTFTLNGAVENLDARGQLSKVLSFGTYTYKVESQGFYPKEGQVTIDNLDKAQALIVNNLRPIMGQLAVHANPYQAKIKVDGKNVGNATSLTPVQLQIGRHQVIVSQSGYRTEEKTVEIKENQTTDISVTLSKEANFIISSNPIGATIVIDKENLGVTPAHKSLISGTYRVQASKKGYKDFNQDLKFDSSNPSVIVSLKQILNYKNEMYFEAGVGAGSMVYFGGGLGLYINNINVEGSYYMGSGKSEDIYWSGNGSQPVTFTYSPSMSASGKVGYGVPLATHFRITPQVGIGFIKLKESAVSSSSLTPADGANVTSGIIGARFSAAITKGFGVSLTPEFKFAVSKSAGYTALSDVSSKIKSWGEGFNIKFTLVAFFNL